MRTKLIALVTTLVVVAVAAVVAFLVLDDDSGTEVRPRTPTTTAASSTAGPATATPAPTKEVAPEWKQAVSTPVEDSVYPNIGDPSVDALHYDLDLTWQPEEQQLSGTTTLTFRAARTQPEFQLDLGDPLEVSSVLLDGVEVDATHIGKDLVVQAPIVADAQHELVVEYAGTPAPYTAPTTRPDFDTIGWTVTDTGAVWTMQEPYGAFTWYPVNDQPADKAFYDFTIRVPAPFVGVANGELVDRSEVDGLTVTEFELASPASSYLVTIAIDDYVMTEDESPSGTPLTYWTPRGNKRALEALRFTPQALAWIEEKLGPYPFDRLGSVVVPSESAMETQTMITYGDSAYTLSRSTVIHEIVHHWYGDIVSPTDWSDVWMNEGMTTYLDILWESEQPDGDLERALDDAAMYDRISRKSDGPPGAYDPRTFGQSNIYYGPALMWHQVRQRIGDEAFWAMAKKWPTVHAHGNSDRATYLDWVEAETGAELSDLFDAWLLGEEQPSR